MTGATIETNVQTAWAILNREWVKFDAEHTLTMEVQRSGAWLNILVKSPDPRRADGLGGGSERYGYNLKDRRWSYNQQPPTNRILKAAVMALESGVKEMDND